MVSSVSISGFVLAKAVSRCSLVIVERWCMSVVIVAWPMDDIASDDSQTSLSTYLEKLLH